MDLRNRDSIPYCRVVEYPNCFLHNMALKEITNILLKSARILDLNGTDPKLNCFDLGLLYFGLFRPCVLFLGYDKLGK